MATVRQGFLAVTEAFTTVSDHWPAVILTADDVLQMFETTFFDHWVKHEKPFTPDNFREYNKKQTANMSILQF